MTAGRPTIDENDSVPDATLTPDAAAAALASGPETGSAQGCKLGVLFVHGIGEQKEGETLLAFGEPLIGWMREWITGHGMRALSESAEERRSDALEWLRHPKRDGIQVTHASLFPSKRHSPDPPHSVIDIRIKHAGQEQRHQRWLLAESWWAEQVQPPPVFDLLGWMFSRGPWVAFAHSAERAWLFTHPVVTTPAASQQARLWHWIDTTWRFMAWPLAAVRFLGAAVSLQLLLLFAWVFALIPIPFVRRYVSAALQMMTTILGDSYGLVANDSQRGAILTRFQDTVNWMQARCDKLVIVAHSQGTAVVHEAMQAELVAAPPLLVTFGSGLAKLHQLRQCELSWQLQLAAAGWILPTALAAGVLQAWFHWGSGEAVEALPLLFVVLYIACLFCALGAWFGWRNTRVEPIPASGSPDGGPRWVDLYASHDPVPQGPLTVHLPGRGIVSEKIVNRRSALSDHTTYWKNKSEFVTRVVAELDKEAHLLGIPDLQSDGEYRRATHHHHRAIQVLSLAWWGIVAFLFAAALGRFDDLANVGKRFLDALAASPFSAFASYLTAAGAGISLAVEGLTGSAPAILPQLGHLALAIGGLLLLLYLWWNVVAALLTRWDSAQLADFLGYERSKVWGPYGTWLVWPFVILVGLLPVPFAVALSSGRSLWSVTLQAVTAAAVLIGLIIAILLLASVAVQVPKDVPAAVSAWRKFVAALADAVAPGSDGPSSPRRGWDSWKAMIGWFVGATMVAGVLGLVIEKLTSRGDATVEFLLWPYAVVAILLLVRFYKLVLQRNYGRWIAVIAVIVPLGLCVYIISVQDPALFPWVRRLSVAGLVMLLATALAYAAVDRWLPPRKMRGLTDD